MTQVTTYKCSCRNGFPSPVSLPTMLYGYLPRLRSVLSCKRYADTINYHPVDPCARIALCHRKSTLAKCNGFDRLLLNRINYAERPVKCRETIRQRPVALVQRNDPEEGKWSGNCSQEEKHFREFRFLSFLPIIRVSCGSQYAPVAFALI